MEIIKKISLFVIFYVVIAYLGMAFIFNTFNSTKFPQDAKWWMLFLVIAFSAATFAVLYVAGSFNKEENNKFNF